VAAFEAAAASRKSEFWLRDCNSAICRSNSLPMTSAWVLARAYMPEPMLAVRVARLLRSFR
jgi:hypothetical protein